MTIRRLDPILIDRIAAGEVVERPASAVKEIVENAIDAGASRIEIVIEQGGRRLIRVTDDGYGMSADDLALAVERHATSKLPDDDLLAIKTLGFRGEALPSIGAVARLSIATRRADASHGSSILVDAGIKHGVKPASFERGTRVEVADLFYATPARLKFLKTDRAEAQAVADMIKRIAMAHPNIRFTLSHDSGTLIDYPDESGSDTEALKCRIGRIMGHDFTDNALPIDAVREEARLYGLAGLGTYHKPTANGAHLFVNGRPVRDRVLVGAIKAAYQDHVPNGRHPAAALFIEVPSHLVDVNVHPAKSEVRFRDPGMIRGLIIGAIRDALVGAGHRASSTVASRTLDALRPYSGGSSYSSQQRPTNWDWRQSPASPGFAEAAQSSFAGLATPSTDQRSAATEPSPADTAHPLGAARAQLHGTYVVAQTTDGIVIVDQHAAHERLVYERLKRERATRAIARQMLLIPAVIDLDPSDAQKLIDRAPVLAELGLVLEPFGQGAIAVSEVPAALCDSDVPALIHDLIDSMEEWGTTLALEDRLDHVLATFACHHSVRAGRRLRPEEMDALLREMEATPNSGQCNHGRPTYVELKLSDIERLFGRS
jgi:DNA mismatch repair protein MutL